MDNGIFKIRPKRDSEEIVDDAGRDARALENNERAKKRYPDYNEVVTNPNLPINKLMFEVLKYSELSADIVYYLGKNPEEAARIYKLSPAEIVEAIQEIEFRLSNKYLH